ncbi:MAG: hypothetical protein RLZZ79_61, partial [Actinomycetota bacterium]
LPKALTELNSAGVKLHCDDHSLEIAKSIGIEAQLAVESNWRTEYGWR